MSGARFPLFKKLLYLGNSPDTPFIESYQNLMFNLFLMVASPFALLVFIINIVSQEYTLALFNAIKFNKANASIYISLHVENQFFVLVIKDEGIGIPTENQDRVFDMFTTAKRKGTAGEKSFGLGLSICKQIVEMHGGNISFTSEAGKGTSFFVKLPFP